MQDYFNNFLIIINKLLFNIVFYYNHTILVGFILIQP